MCEGDRERAEAEAASREQSERQTGRQAGSREETGRAGVCVCARTCDTCTRERMRMLVAQRRLGFYPMSTYRAWVGRVHWLAAVGFTRELMVTCTAAAGCGTRPNEA